MPMYYMRSAIEPLYKRWTKGSRTGAWIIPHTGGLLIKENERYANGKVRTVVQHFFSTCIICRVFDDISYVEDGSIALVIILVGLLRMWCRL